MKKIAGIFAIGAALLGSTTLSSRVAFAGQNDDVVARLNAAEQENAAMRKQTAQLAATASAKPVSITDKMMDFFGAYAADLPVAYKARPPVEPGRLTLWGQGGAIWTGGDQVARSFSLNDFTTVGLTRGCSVFTTTGIAAICTESNAASLVSSSSNTGTIPGIFNLDPKVGWTAATGFDYKFAASPWHVSGQFRYGDSRTSGSASSAGALDASGLALANFEGANCFSPIADGRFPTGGPITACGGSQSRGVNYKETHWLADLALGYDVVSGPSYVQVKGGVRISEFVAARTTTSNQTNFVSFSNPIRFTQGEPGFTSLSISSSGTFNNRTNFLGTGPVIGLEGSARFLSNWSFDYKGDLGVLFGTQNALRSGIGTTSTSPTALGILNVCCGDFSSGGFSYANNSARFVTMLSPDIEVGFSYWFMPNVKVSASYRVDALIAVKNQKYANANTLLLPQRFWHGPLVGLSASW